MGSEEPVRDEKKLLEAIVADLLYENRMLKNVLAMYARRVEKLKEDLRGCREKLLEKYGGEGAS